MIRGMLVIIGVSIFAAGGQTRKTDPGFPNTKRQGKAIIEYRDAQLDVVLSYQYSQEHHDSSWLLIDFGARSERRFVIDREHFRLVSATGEWFPIASERHFIESGPQIAALRQNATIWKRDVTTYLGPATRTPLKFFALPGDGVILTGALVDREHNTVGELYFENPRGAWDSGEYALLIEHPKASIKLPLSFD